MIRNRGWRQAEDGSLELLLDPPEFEKVRQGYACSHCGEDYMGERRLRCPVCGEAEFAGFELKKGDTSWVLPGSG